MRRFVAFYIDALLAYSFFHFGSNAFAFLQLALCELTGREIILADEWISQTAWLGGWVWGMSFIFINFGFLQGITGSSLGKFCTDLKAVDRNGEVLGMPKSIFRTLGYSLSIFTVGFGFLMAYRTKNSKALHDYLVKSTVEFKNSPENQPMPSNIICLPAPEEENEPKLVA